MYVKIEGVGGGSSGSGITNIELYDWDKQKLPLVKSDVIDTNANTRNAETNYVEMFQNRGGLSPYSTNPNLIYYIIKIPEYEHVEGISSVYLANWGNSSYNANDISVSISYDNISFIEIYKSTFNVGEKREIPLDYSFIAKMILLHSNNKTYSTESISILHETKMTSNTAPAPLVASASSVYNTTSYNIWKAFSGDKSLVANNCWLTANGQNTGWIQIDFGRMMTINAVEILNVTTLDQALLPKDFQVLVSTDNVTFSEILSIKNESSKPSEIKKYRTKEATARYCKINISKNGDYPYTGFSNIEFSFVKDIALNIPVLNTTNFHRYGSANNTEIDGIFIRKNYILQDSISENSEGLWTTQLDRKPLSISFN